MPKVFRGARILLSVGLLTFLATRISWGKVGEVLRDTNPAWIALALLAGPILTALMAWRLRLLLIWAGAMPTFLAVWRITWTAQFMNSFLPGSTGGDFFKLFELRRYWPGNISASAAAVVADRLYALAALGLLALTAFFTAKAPWTILMREHIHFNVPVLLGLAAGLVALSLLYSTRDRWLNRWKSGRMLSHHLGGILKRSCGFFSSPRVVTLTLGAALAGHIVNFFIVYCLARSIRIPISFPEIMGLMPILMLILFLPVTVNGHGLREVLLIAYFSWLFADLRQPAAGLKEWTITLSLLMVTTDFLISCPGALWQLFRRKADAVSGLQVEAVS